MLPSVMVPVLSKQSTSTWASVSREYSSCTNTLRFAKRPTPTAKLMLINRTRPLGSMPSKPAAVETTEVVGSPPRKKNASKNNTMPKGIIKNPVKRVTFLIEVTNSECTCFIFLASCAICVA